MAQIPEYTRRETFSATDRPSVGLDIPDALSRGSNGVFSSDNLKKVVGGAKEIAGEMLDMKDRYDKAKANEYLNNYIKNAQQKVLEYKTNRLGKLSEGVVSDFEEWSENEFNNAMGKSENSSDEPLLSNREQITLARERMDNLNLNYLNTLSSFQAQQMQEYSDNQATALITNLSTEMSREQDINNMQNIKLEIFKTASVHSDLIGQSKEYVSQHLSPIISKSLSQNIMSTALNNPDYSIDKLENKFFVDNISDEDYLKTSDDVEKAFKEFYAEKISDAAVHGVNIDVAANVALDRPFFENKNADKILSDINVLAEKKRKEKIEFKRKGDIALQNSIVVKLAKSGFDLNNLSENDFATLSTMQDGRETVQLIKKIKTDKEVYDYDLENGIETKPITFDEYKSFGTIKSRISEGQYSTLGEMYEDVFDLPSPLQQKLVGDFVNNVIYKNAVEELKEKNGIDIASYIDQAYKDNIGLDKSKSINSYNIFRNGIIDGIRGIQLSGGKIDSNTIKTIALNVSGDLVNPTTYENRMFKIIKDYEANKIKNKKSGTENLINSFEDFIEADPIIGSAISTEGSLRELSELLYVGDVDGAVMFVREQLDNKELKARKQRNEKSIKKMTKNVVSEITGIPTFEDMFLF